MNWAVFKYLVGHRFYSNHKRFKSHIYFFHETKSVCLHCIRLSFTEISVTFKVWRGEWWWNELAEVPYYFPAGKWTSSFIYAFLLFHPDERASSFIFKQIEENHGRTVLQASRKLISQYSTIEKQFSRLRFNNACKNLGILPRSLKFSPPIKSRKGYRIAKNFGWQFLNLRITECL